MSQNGMGLQKNCHITKVTLFLSCVNFLVNIFFKHKNEEFCQKNFRISNYTLFQVTNIFYASPNDMVFQENCQFENIKPNLGSVNFFLNYFLEIYVIGPLRFPIKIGYNSILVN